MAATPTIEKFRRYYPSFADFSDETAEVYLDHAASYVGVDRACLGTDENRAAAIYALTAHLLFMLRLGGQGLSGPLSSASEGSVGAHIAVAAIGRRSWFQESPFGRLFWQIMAPCRAGGCQYTPHKYHPWG